MANITFLLNWYSGVNRKISMMECILLVTASILWYIHFIRTWVLPVRQVFSRFVNQWLTQVASLASRHEQRTVRAAFFLPDSAWWMSLDLAWGDGFSITASYKKRYDCAKRQRLAIPLTGWREPNSRTLAWISFQNEYFSWKFIWIGMFRQDYYHV